MDVSHNFLFTNSTINNRIADRKQFLIQKSISDSRLANEALLEAVKDNHLQSLIIKHQETINELCQTPHYDKDTILKLTVKSEFYNRYIRKYMFYLEPPLKFQVTDDVHGHTSECLDCQAYLLQVEERYQTYSFNGGLEYRDILYITAQFKAVGVKLINGYNEMIDEVTQELPGF